MEPDPSEDPFATVCGARPSAKAISGIWNRAAGLVDSPPQHRRAMALPRTLLACCPRPSRAKAPRSGHLPQPTRRRRSEDSRTPLWRACWLDRRQRRLRRAGETRTPCAGETDRAEALAQWAPAEHPLPRHASAAQWRRPLRRPSLSAPPRVASSEAEVRAVLALALRRLRLSVLPCVLLRRSQVGAVAVLLQVLVDRFIRRLQGQQVLEVLLDSKVSFQPEVPPAVKLQDWQQPVPMVQDVLQGLVQHKRQPREDSKLRGQDLLPAHAPPLVHEVPHPLHAMSSARSQAHLRPEKAGIGAFGWRRVGLRVLELAIQLLVVQKGVAAGTSTMQRTSVRLAPGICARYVVHLVHRGLPAMKCALPHAYERLGEGRTIGDAV
eukprot:scaffold748_cov251-Pinguiococcus_pyrenoidosus.AAC.62